MNPFRFSELLSISANLLLGIALMGGGAFLARRSLASATWMVIAGFGVVSADVLRSMMPAMMVRFQIAPFYAFAPISLFEAVVSLGGIFMAIQTLPPRTA
jgi:hypothetical protein